MSQNSTTTPSASIGLGITSDVGVVAGAAEAGIKLFGQVDAELNTPAQVDAAIESHAQFLKDKLQRAIQQKDLATLRKMAQS